MPSSPTPTWAPELLARAYYSDDSVVLIHGDCLELADLWTCADVLVTDPPYGVRFEQRFGDTRNGMTRRDHPRAQQRTMDAISNDCDVLARDRVLSLWGKRPAVVFGGFTAHASKHTKSPDRPRQIKNLLIWHKANAHPGPMNQPFFTNFEEIYILGKGAWRKSSPPLYSVITTFEARASYGKLIGHPNAKPIALLTTLIDRCPPGIIADPFAGSGSTLVAAKALGRKAIGVELEERYCEIAARRLSQDVLDFTEATE